MIDSHCHLAGDEFEADLPAVVDRAREAGLTGALVILAAGDGAEAQRAVRVREVWPEARFAVGIHPHSAGAHAADLDRSIQAIAVDLTARHAVAVGEIGLDYHYDFSPRAVQQEVFRRQLRLARERELPIVIHTREASEDTFQILRHHGDGLRMVFHCFTGDMEMATTAIEIGAWISFAGIVTFPRALDLREVARAVPIERLLVETDAPYLAPVPHRGQRNEPAMVVQVVETIARLRGETVERMAELTSENFRAVFEPG